MTNHRKKRKRREEKRRMKAIAGIIQSPGVRRHTRLAGRSGHIADKQTPSSAHVEYIHNYPNPPYVGTFPARSPRDEKDKEPQT